MSHDLKQAIAELSKACMVFVETLTSFSAALPLDDGENEAVKPEKKDKEMTLLELRKVLAKVSAEGRTEDVKKAIEAFGVTRLSEVPPAKYGTLLEALGVKIDA